MFRIELWECTSLRMCQIRKTWLYCRGIAYWIGACSEKEPFGNDWSMHECSLLCFELQQLHVIELKEWRQQWPWAWMRVPLINPLSPLTSAMKCFFANEGLLITSSVMWLVTASWSDLIWSDQIQMDIVLINHQSSRGSRRRLPLDGVESREPTSRAKKFCVCPGLCRYFYK